MANPLSRQLDDLEERMAALAAPARPVDVSAEARERVLAMLTAVHAAHPGAWAPLTAAADHLRDKLMYRECQKAVRELVHDGVAEDILRYFRVDPIQVYRLTDDTLHVDPAPIEAAVNTALKPLRYKVELNPARVTQSNFRTHKMVHNGRIINVYEKLRDYEARLIGTAD